MELTRVTTIADKFKENLHKVDTKADNGFGELFSNALQEVNKLQQNSETQNKLLATGQIDNIHEVMIASEKANIALQFTVGVRNKVVDAYKEIMRMQI